MAHIRRPLNMGRPVFYFRRKSICHIRPAVRIQLFYPARQPAYARLRLPAEILLATGSSAADWSAQCRILYRRSAGDVCTCRLRARSHLPSVRPMDYYPVGHMHAAAGVPVADNARHIRPGVYNNSDKHIGILECDIRRTKQCRIPRDSKGQPVGGPTGFARMGMGSRSNIPDCRTFYGVRPACS